MISLVLTLILIFCNLIFAFVQSLAAKSHNYVIIENTFPKEKLQDPKVLSLTKEYRTRLFQTAFILSIFDLLLLIPMKDSLFMTLFFVLLFLTIGSNYSLLIYYIRKTRKLIVDNDWQLPSSPVQINTRLLTEKNRKLLSVWCFIPSFVLTGILSWISHSMQQPFSILFLVMISAILVFFVLGWWFIGRLPIRPLTENQEINQKYNDLTKFYWSFLIVFMSTAFPVIFYLPLLTMNFSADLFVLLTFLEAALLIFFCGFTCWWLLRLRKKQDQLLQQTETFRYQGDDYYWRYGMYYNPDDTRVMVPDRIGMNLSVNLARTGGKISLGLVAVLLFFAMLFTIGPLYILDYHPDPLTSTVTQKQVTLDAPFTPQRVIPFRSIQSAELIDKVPEILAKTNGLATQNYSIGNFKVADRPAVMYVDRQSTPVLKIKTAERDYYFTSKQPEQTKNLYQQIQNHLQNN
jgi:hypothetical protein